LNVASGCYVLRTRTPNHHEVKLVQLSFDFYMIEAMPDVLIGDRAYDSDDLDDDLSGKRRAALEAGDGLGIHPHPFGKVGLGPLSRLAQGGDVRPKAARHRCS
jgi:hypothetical protein